MQHLAIRRIECHSFHGCLKEESVIGSRFSVDVLFSGDFYGAVVNDDLSQTVDYVEVHRIVREEMAVASKLIEHVAGRILNRMKDRFPRVQSCRVEITKYNPPVNGQLGEAIFSIEG
ncbi:MAG: dihydroneopterin aldolase [Bacteroidota bacterium]|jgi:dihydroneopterin aldolase